MGGALGLALACECAHCSCSGAGSTDMMREGTHEQAILSAVRSKCLVY